MKKRIMILFCAAVMSFCFLPCGAAEQTDTNADGWTMIAENSRLSLAVDLETSDFSVKDKENGFVWYSTPRTPNGTSVDDTVLSRLRSCLSVTYIDSNLNAVSVTSFEESVSTGDFEIRKTGDGFCTTYFFKKAEMDFSIPLRIMLKEDYIEAKILYDGIKENGDAVIYTIDMLPYFGAGSMDENGYLFIPDGCGALVSFDGAARRPAHYRKRVYGDDPSVDLLLKASGDKSEIHIPVFGIKRNDSALLGVITDCAAEAFTDAESNSLYSPYSSVCASFIYHQKDLTGIRDRQANQRTVTMTEKKAVSVSPTVNYYVLNGEKANYSGFAEKLRAMYSVKEKRAAGNEVYLSFYGMTRKKTSFLGIPYYKKTAATTYKKAAETVKNLKKNGVEKTAVQLYGFSDAGYAAGRAKKQSFPAALGGKSGFKELSGAADILYGMYDPIRDYNVGLGLFNRTKYIKAMNRVNVKRQQPRLSTGDWAAEDDSWNYLTPDSARAAADKYISSLGKNGNTGSGFSRIGSEIYGNRDPYAPGDRNITEKSYLSILKKAGKKGAVLTEGANAYAVTCSNAVTFVPHSGGEHDIFTASVPFYQMVFGGITELVSIPLNRCADRAAALQALLETGTVPSYEITGCDFYELSGTSLEFLYNTEATEEYMDEISAAAKKYGELLSKIGNKRIRSYEIHGDLRITEYENGCITVSNRGSEPIEYNRITVQPGEVVPVQKG